MKITMYKASCYVNRKTEMLNKQNYAIFTGHRYDPTGQTIRLVRYEKHNV